MLKDNVIFKNIFLFLSIIPFCFLVYTLTHLNRLEIPIYHPRVIVELAFVITFLTIGIIMKAKGI